MFAALLILLLLCLFGVAQTYLIYPVATLRAAERRCRPDPAKGNCGAWPTTYVLMSVYNEEAILPEKLATLAALKYRGTLEFHFASDRSTDRSTALLEEFLASHPGRLQVNADRLGKPGSINALVANLPPGGIYVFTDASVMLRDDTVTELVRAILADDKTGLCDATMVHTGVPPGGVGALEDTYIRREVDLKRAESCLWRKMIGPFGGCWAMRAEAYRPVPDTYLVDDFYLCMAAYEAGWNGVSAPGAVAYEGVGLQLRDEFRRKRRIGAGNWQNLIRFRGLWWPPSQSPLAYAFCSHKVLRWLSPLLLAVGAMSLLGLLVLTGNYWTATAFLLLTVFICAVIPALRYFAAMNVALLLGMVDYLNGIKTNVWQPSHRNKDAG